MLSTRLILAAALSISAADVHAQQRSTADADSARRVVQRFYDWYVPRAANPRGRDMVLEAATHGPVPFDPELVRWLRIDSTARARAKGEVDGLDGDPYLNAQDPCDTYSAQSAAPAAAERVFMVMVLGHGGCAAHKRPDIIVEISYRASRWTILEFRDPRRQNEGTIPLLKRLHPTAK
jgi:hypothetical protein